MNEILLRRRMAMMQDSDPVIISTSSNPLMMSLLYECGFSPRRDYMTKSEAEAVQGDMTFYSWHIDDNGVNGLGFHEFQYFTSATSLVMNSRDNSSGGFEAIIPENVTTFKSTDSSRFWYRIKKVNLLCPGNRVIARCSVSQIQAFNLYVPASMISAYEIEYSPISVAHIYDMANWDSREIIVF